MGRDDSVSEKGPVLEVLSDMARELQSRLQKNRTLLERHIEETVKAVSDRLAAPLRDEVSKLQRRLEQGEGRIEEEIKRRQ